MMAKTIVILCSVFLFITHVAHCDSVVGLTKEEYDYDYVENDIFAKAPHVEVKPRYRTISNKEMPVVETRKLDKPTNGRTEQRKDFRQRQRQGISLKENGGKENGKNITKKQNTKRLKQKRKEERMKKRNKLKLKSKKKFYGKKKSTMLKDRRKFKKEHQMQKFINPSSAWRQQSRKDKRKQARLQSHHKNNYRKQYNIPQKQNNRHAYSAL